MQYLKNLKRAINKKNRLAGVCVLLLPALVFFHAPIFATQELSPKNVLIIAAYKPTSPVAHQWDRGIRSVFENDASKKVNINIEYLDIAHFNDNGYARLVLDLLRHKYSQTKPDLIIAVYNPSLGFLMKHEAVLFPGVPIVFAGVEQRFLEHQPRRPNITGLLSVHTYAATLDLALALHPNTQRVAVVAGTGPIGQSWLKTAQVAYRRYEDRLKFDYLVGLPLPELLEQVENLHSNTVLIYLPVLQDNAGQKFDATDVLRAVSSASSAPTYSFWELLLGHGIVGGYLSSAEEKGRQAAQLGLQIMNGAKPSDLPVSPERNFKYEFDWRELKRWSVPESRLPAGSTIKFKTFTVWDKYRGRIISAVALMTLQVFIIFLLLHQRRTRRRAEEKIEERLKFEKFHSKLSSKFTGISSEKFDAKIADALALTGQFMQADRSHMFRINWNRKKFRITHLWETEGIKKDDIVLPGLIVKDTFPWLFENLLSGDDVIIPDVEILSADRSINEYQYCRTLGIQSFIILPIRIENAPLCAIGLDSINRKREWPREIQDRLRIIGEIFANTIVRRHAEKKSEEAALRYRTVADFTYDLEYWQNPDGSLQYISPSCERICGYSVQDLITNPSLLQDMIVPEDKAVWDKHRCSIQNEKQSEEIQFRIQKPDGEIRWIEHACQPVFDHKGNKRGVRASNRDITKREFYRSETHKLESELAHMDRVVTISTLTSALAHEINQPLAAMRSYAQAALRFMDKDQPEYDSVRKALQGIVADNKRAAEVVNRLRDLVKKRPTHRETIEINSIINEVIGLVNSELVLRNASIKLDLHQNVPLVLGDSIQIQQVMINLLTNALDAMDDQPIDARTIAITTRSENSSAIIVSISDSGGGIPPDNIETIFFPFHTTKSAGMGLGLSICNSIIEAHGGKISAENNPDGGAIFSFTLPPGNQTA